MEKDRSNSRKNHNANHLPNRITFISDCSYYCQCQRYYWLFLFYEILFPILIIYSVGMLAAAYDDGIQWMDQKYTHPARIYTQHIICFKHLFIYINEKEMWKLRWNSITFIFVNHITRFITISRNLQPNNEQTKPCTHRVKWCKLENEMKKSSHWMNEPKRPRDYFLEFTVERKLALCDADMHVSQFFSAAVCFFYQQILILACLPCVCNKRMAIVVHI